MPQTHLEFASRTQLREPSDLQVQRFGEVSELQLQRFREVSELQAQRFASMLDARFADQRRP